MTPNIEEKGKTEAYTLHPTPYTLHLRAIFAIVLLAGAALLAWPLGSWQRREAREAAGLNNLRRLGQGLLLYTQDWDDRPMPPVFLSAGQSVTWPETILPYIEDKGPLENPLNPLQKETHSPRENISIRSGYALNNRFANTFGPGTYPLDDLEMPYRTALFVEAGPMWADPLHRPKEPAAVAALDYGDTGDTINGLFAYPSAHNGKIALVAADGHAELVAVAHYRPEDGPHDKQYGRIGGAMYNWNGGFPAGETDKPPRE